MSRFLVLEADRATLDAMTYLLRDDGHDVVPLQSCVEALATLAKETFDVVIGDFDARLGCTVAQRARETSPRACIVLTTAECAEPHEHVCLVVEKPIHYDAVIASVTRCLAHGGHGSVGCHRDSPSHADALTLFRRRR